MKKKQKIVFSFDNNSLESTKNLETQCRLPESSNVVILGPVPGIGTKHLKDMEIGLLQQQITDLKGQLKMLTDYPDLISDFYKIINRLERENFAQSDLILKLESKLCGRCSREMEAETFEDKIIGYGCVSCWDAWDKETFPPEVLDRLLNKTELPEAA
jgi:hypothetical protein